MADHRGSYSESSFWKKCRGAASAAGKEVLEKALWLYFAMQKEDCPAWAKAAIIGALAYFIFPADAIPDIVPVAGYTDDLSVLAGAVATVASQIDREVKRKATVKLGDWGLA